VKDTPLNHEARKLGDAYKARDAAREMALRETDRQFAAHIAARLQAYHDELRRAVAPLMEAPR
jgi:hypothetical protein